MTCNQQLACPTILVTPCDQDHDLRLKRASGPVLDNVSSVVPVTPDDPESTCSSDPNSTPSPSRSPSKREAAVAAERAAAAEQLGQEMNHLRGQLRATR